MASGVAVSVEHVSKRFRLYHEKYQTLKERVIHFGNLPFEEHWALQDVSMEIYQGETVGLLGHNGSGKSTLLKCIAGILRPTKGKIRVRGQLAAMLELGAGFNPELSGRDNIYLNATLLGMPKREIDRRFDEIVAFSELEHFIDNQVKFYSSGMYAKLGFAVAVSFEPDVLLVDEVLAVGDERFQRKCLDKIAQFQADGRTIIIVSHAPDLLRQVCDRAFVLENGRQIAGGPVADVVRIFREHLFQMDQAAGGAHAQAPGGGGVVKLGDPEVSYPDAGSRPYLLPGEWLEITLPYRGSEAARAVVFAISIRDREGRLVYATDTKISNPGVVDARGEGRVKFRFESIPLLDGAYDVSFSATSAEGGIVYDLSDQRCRFEVMNPGREQGSIAMAPSIEVEAASSRLVADQAI
jgi:ABC-type polysaccharide/polyol phosphate transport system ATPase subunit